MQHNSYIDSNSGVVAVIVKTKRKGNQQDIVSFLSNAIVV